jgi:hypothetical protein
VQVRLFPLPVHEVVQVFDEKAKAGATASTMNMQAMAKKTYFQADFIQADFICFSPAPQRRHGKIICSATGCKSGFCSRTRAARVSTGKNLADRMLELPARGECSFIPRSCSDADSARTRHGRKSGGQGVTRPNGDSMKKLLIGAALALPLSFVILPASALPAARHGAVIGEQLSPDLIEAKWGHGRGWGRVHAFGPPGWGRGRKVGWRGHGCPPGHWKKGWC